MTPPTPLLMVSMPANVEAMLMVPELFKVVRPPPKFAAGPAPSLAVHVPILLKTLLPSGRLMRPSNVPALLMTIWPVVTGEEIARSLASPLVDRITPPALLLIVVVPVPLVAEMTGLATEPVPSTMLLMLMVLLPAPVVVAMATPPVAEMAPFALTVTFPVPLVTAVMPLALAPAAWNPRMLPLAMMLILPGLAVFLMAAKMPSPFEKMSFAVTEMLPVAPVPSDTARMPCACTGLAAS